VLPPSGRPRRLGSSPESLGARSTLYEYRRGAATSLGDINSWTSLRVAGGFAIWNVGVALFRRDLASGTNTIVASDAGNNSNDVAANGDVVYWTSNYDIVRVRDDVATSITDDGSTIWDVYPATDGDIIAWQQVQQGGNPGGTGAFVDNSTIQLGSGPGQQPLVSNGWIAFTKPVPGGTRQVFVRSPAGDERQVSLFSAGAYLEALSSDGAVIFSTGVELRRRYLVPPGGDAIEIGSWLGRGLFVGSDAYVRHPVQGSLTSLRLAESGAMAARRAPGHYRSGTGTDRADGGVRRPSTSTCGHASRSRASHAERAGQWPPCAATTLPWYRRSSGVLFRCCFIVLAPGWMTMTRCKGALLMVREREVHGV
jgi:hypothetical protein